MGESQFKSSLWFDHEPEAFFIVIERSALTQEDILSCDSLICEVLKVSQASGAAASRRSDRTDHRGFGLEDLIGNLTSMHFNLSGKGKGQANPIALDRSDADDSQGFARISNYDFLSLPSGYN